MLSEKPSKASEELSASATISWYLARRNVPTISPLKQSFSGSKNVDSLSTKASVSLTKIRSNSSVTFSPVMVSHPTPRRLKDIIYLQTLMSASEVRSLLATTNYCSRFIPDYATKTEPLRRLTHKDQPWGWTPQHDGALNELKDALAKAPVTAYFDPAKDTEIRVDASPVGLAAILSQTDQATRINHIITYASRSLTKKEQRYSQTEYKALAIVWACEHLHLYIYGKPATVYADHKPLVSIFGNPSSKPPPRIERWALRRKPYQLTVQYRKGEGNPTDYLSHRQPREKKRAPKSMSITSS